MISVAVAPLCDPIRRRIVGLCLGLGTALLPIGCARQDASSVWRIEPGGSVGVLDASESEADLAAAYGAANVRPASIHLGEGLMAAGTVLFPGDSLQRLEILWQDGAQRRFPARVILRGNRSRWKLPKGITLGTTLHELEDINRRPFRLAGFGWDYAGVVLSWNGGVLDSILTRTKVYLAPSDEARERPGYTQVQGDRKFASDGAPMWELNPAIYQIFVDFPVQATPGDSAAASS